MAQAIAKAGLAGVYSYAGRTDAPMGQPIHMRVGGFGGVSADFQQRLQVVFKVAVVGKPGFRFEVDADFLVHASSYAE